MQQNGETSWHNAYFCDLSLAAGISALNLVLTSVMRRCRPVASGNGSISPVAILSIGPSCTRTSFVRSLIADS